MSESSTASSRTAVALKSTELDRVIAKKGQHLLSLFLVLYFFTPGVPGMPGTSNQDRKDKQACEPNLACLLKARGARAQARHKREKTSKL